MAVKTIDFKRYSSIHIGPKIEVEVIDIIGNYNDYRIIGKANNLLISNNPPPIAILGENFDYIIEKENKLIVGAATSSGKLLTYCKKHNIADFEFLAKLPGTIGGLTKMNAGLKQWEIFNLIDGITTNKGTLTKDKVPHSYRSTKIDGIIFEVVFNINKTGYCKENQKKFTQMRDNQPNNPSAGSCFKNPEKQSAGYLLEQSGLKGYRIGDMAFSDIHANFLVNLGNGTYEEAIELINIAKIKVNEKFNIILEIEIDIIN
ncbi:MAG: UDP-N-acetylmuramate dehydrogenase [Campylobacterota bacterium]|nr:UDP-N-acetylmuramate dehydrogenase [Campylobacterota bacterium]